MMTDIIQIKRMLAEQAQAVAEKLLPNGRKDGHEWRCGSTAGDAGQSLGIHLAGTKAGVWADFNTGEGGDLLDLWREVRGLSLPEALDEARSWLGVEVPEPYRDPTPRYQRPPKPKCQTPQDKVHAYLTVDRNLPVETINAFRIGEDGDKIIFPFLLPNGELALAKSREAKEGGKTIPTAKDCEPVLYGWQALPENAREVAITEGECLPGTTEVLTRYGWTRLDEYSGGKVAQWENGKLEWVYPEAKIDKPYDDDLIQFANKFVTMTVTPGHRMPGIDKHGRTVVLTAQERESGFNRYHKLPKSGVLNGSGIGLLRDELALCLAVSADATIDTRKQSYAGGPARNIGAEDRYARIAVFRERKIERLSGILERLGLQHCRTDNVSTGQRSDGVFFGVPLPDWVPGRMLPWEWIERATADEREFLIAELRHWDGNEVNNRYQHEFSSRHKELADWVQALCHTTGRCSTIMERKNDFGLWFKVSILHGKSTGSYQSLARERVPGPSRVYCLTVPSGMFLARENGRVFVTGNCDAMSLHAYGIAAMSVPFGGGKGAKQQWIEHEFDRLQRFEKIYLCLDMDKTGEEAAEEIAARLGRHRCMRVSLPRKDANECLMDGITPEEINECFRKASHMDPDGLKRPSDYVDDVINLFWPKPGVEEGYTLPYGKLRDKLYFRPAEITLWSGHTGDGKSQILSDGTVDFIKQGSKVCLASLEMVPKRTLKRKVKQVTGTDRPTDSVIRATHEWLDQGLIIYGHVGKATVEGLLEVFDYARAKYGCDQFIIDSLMRIGIANDDYVGQERAVFQIVDWAVEHNVHVHLVAHARKPEKGTGVPNTSEIKGAMEIGANAFNVILVWRNRQQEDDLKEALETGNRQIYDEVNQKPGVILNIAKQRNGDFEGKIGLWFDQQSYRYASSMDRSAQDRRYLPEDWNMQAAE